jgi:quinol monooxygenase YgiN
MRSRPGGASASMSGVAAMFLALVASACTQSTRGNNASPQRGTSDTSTRIGTLNSSGGGAPGMIVRISEIQIAPERLDEYKAILKEEAAASVRLEPGVISIFPMFQPENPTEVRILEIYASRAAYEAHIKSPHFERYKTTTLPMVRSLKLVDMETMDPATMPAIFGKMRREK